MKSLTLCLVVLLAALATLHNAACQDETTTTLAPDTQDKPQDTTEVPIAAETVPAESTVADNAKDITEPTLGSTVTEEKQKEEENKEEPSTEAPETKDVAPKDESKDETVTGDERQPKDQGADQEPVPEIPQEPPKLLFVTQHVRDPVTGVVYSRQVPLIPSNYLRPMPYRPDMRRDPAMQPVPAQPETPQEPSSFDPLGQYNDQQKKRQFYQDMLLTQLSRFEKEVEPMAEREENITQKNDIEELLGSVAELKQKLENHLIFNISEIMNNWKQGKIADGQSEPSYNEPSRPMPPQAYGRPQQRLNGPPVTLRTLILVPHNRVMNQQAQPQYNPYPQMSRQIPIFHIRRAPYQPTMYATEGQPQVAKPTEQLEPQPTGNEEYSNHNEIFGY